MSPRGSSVAPGLPVYSDEWLTACHPALDPSLRPLVRALCERFDLGCSWHPRAVESTVKEFMASGNPAYDLEAQQEESYAAPV